MASCPECKTEWSEPHELCPICGHDLRDDAQKRAWVLIGSIDDKLSADFARETLTAYEIPVVIVSKSGFFGNIGLPLTSFYSGSVGLFEVSVPAEHEEEAVDILAMALGGKWHRKEN